MNGQPPCGEVSYTENNMTGFVNSFAGAVSTFPYGGSLIAGLIQPTYSMHQFRCVEGSKFDYRSFYSVENVLIISFVVLVIIYAIMSKK